MPKMHPHSWNFFKMKLPLFFQLNQMNKTGASIADIELAANRSATAELALYSLSIADIELAANRSMQS